MHQLLIGIAITITIIFTPWLTGLLLLKSIGVKSSGTKDSLGTYILGAFVLFILCSIGAILYDLGTSGH